MIVSKGSWVGRRVWLCTLAVAVAACQDGTQPEVPATSNGMRENIVAARPQALPARGIEAEFVSLEQQLPGFGGLYLDEEGDIVAYVSEPTNEAARGLITTAFLGTEARRNRLAKATGAIPQVHLVRGDYSFSELHGWKGAIRDAAQIRHGIVEFDANERLNRVSLAVLPSADLDAIESLAADMGIPAVALDIRVMDERPVTAASLTDKVRPVVAGYRTSNSWYSSAWCSAGHIVTVSSTWYILTASHCIPNFTGGTGAGIWQDGNDVSEKIGTVSSNPAWSTTGCTAGSDYCSNADAALVAFDTGISGSKKVAQSSSVGTGNSAGNLTVGSTFTIGTQENSLAVGTEVHRTGQTTGSTKGNIEATCVDIQYVDNLTGNVLEVTCATRGDFRADPGDSGGPVYRWRIPLVTTSRSALGVVFAVNQTGDRKTWYSPMAEVITRLGSMYAF